LYAIFFTSSPARSSSLTIDDGQHHAQIDRGRLPLNDLAALLIDFDLHLIDSALVDPDRVDQIDSYA
jgi:hypothetical protein